VLGLRLHHRIVVPFVLVTLFTTTLAAVVALTVASGTLRGRERERLLGAAGVIAKSDLAINPAIVRSLRQLTGFDVITFSHTGEVLTTTFDQAGQADVIGRVKAGTGNGTVREVNGSPILNIDCGFPCFVVVRRLETRPDVQVALVSNTSELSAATRSITRAIVITAALSIFLMALVTRAVAQRVTAPIDRLVGFVKEVAPSGSHRRAHVRKDEIGRLASAFNDMLDRLDASQEALIRSEKLALAGLLAARVAHDIRNPLSGIKMQTQLLRASLANDPEQAAAADAVLHDIDQVESVIRDLLELARPGELKLAATPINAVLSDVVRQMGPQLAYRKISVDLALDGRISLISIDLDRLRQALLNVISNAADAMPSGGRIAISTRRNPEEDAITVEICDEGTGIPAELLDRVFDPFVSTKRDGVGLGLVNAKAVVESHGGRISLHRREPKGTCASIVLPVSGKPSSSREVEHG
jgi:signal transduction histidine kinase